MFEITDYQKIGIGLTGFGLFFLFLGVVFLFDKGLLALGNILFLSGLAFVIGLERTFRFFFQRHKLKGSVAFFGGILIVLFGWPLVGMLIEIYGFIVLFRAMVPKKYTKSSRMYDHASLGCEILSWVFISGFTIVWGCGMIARPVSLREFYGLYGVCIKKVVSYNNGFLPIVVNFLRRVPVLGTILNFPILNKIIDKIAGDPNRSMV